jgi:hypothetical protein
VNGGGVLPRVPEALLGSIILGMPGWKVVSGGPWPRCEAAIASLVSGTKNPLNVFVF